MHDLPSRRSTDQVSVLRVIDAAANRTLEGLRVVEDTVRFGWDDRHLTSRLKQIRHRVTEILSSPAFAGRINARDTLNDVGTDLRTPQEAVRNGLPDVIAANFGRVEEGLRTLAECAKVIDPKSAEPLEQSRYEIYTLQKAVHNMQRNIQRLDNACLYVLVDGGKNAKEFEASVRELIEGRIDLIQLRDKRLDDRQLYHRAKRLCELTRECATPNRRTLAVINDRADIAAAVRADGVHVGQEELPVAAARFIVGPDTLIGVSTHNMEQARQAVLDGADYIGVGPTFESRTKAFETFPGLKFAAQVASEIRLPAFAIGGIDTSNVEQVVQAGLRRVAISAAITQSSEPHKTIRELQEVLQASEDE